MIFSTLFSYNYKLILGHHMNLWNIEWNLLPLFQSFSLSEKGLILELLGKIALSVDNKINIPSNDEFLELGINPDNFYEIINKLKNIHPKPLMLRFDMASACRVLTSPYLNQLENGLAEKKRQEIRKIQDLNSPNNSLATRLDNDLAPIVSFLPADQRNTDTFTSWMPTIRFNSEGQVYNISKKSIENWSEQFENINIKSSLSDIFFYFVKNINKRVPSAHINRFILSWLEKESRDILEADYSKETSENNSIDNLFADLSKKTSQRAI